MDTKMCSLVCSEGRICRFMELTELLLILVILYFDSPL